MKSAIAFMKFFYIALILAISPLTIAIHSPPTKLHADGSISSNSGPQPILDHLRPKRNYYGNSVTSDPSNGISLGDAQIIVDEHNRYRKTVSLKLNL